MKNACTLLLAGAVGCALAMPVALAKPQVTFIYSFGNATDAASPFADLTSANGLLFGTTKAGGLQNDGAAFSFDPKTGKEQVFYSFCSQAGCADGAHPVAGLISSGSLLYGTTLKGGSNQSGTAFSLDPDTGSEQVLHSFGSGGGDGVYPASDLMNLNGTLYGTTGKGGSNGKGSVFSLNTATGAVQTVYSYCSQQNCTDGKFPEANLINVNGTLYGTAERGGANNGGVVFSLDPGTGTEQVIYSFCSQPKCTDGAYPLAGLVSANGLLYGVTSNGGAHIHYGSVFSVDPGTGAEQVLYSFCSAQNNCTDGEYPYSSLINVNGKLYGTTAYGGAFNGGEVFAFDPGKGTNRIIYSFCTQQNCPEGHLPEASLINVNGVLYGTTVAGGQFGFGTIFSIKNP